MEAEEALAPSLGLLVDNGDTGLLRAPPTSRGRVDEDVNGRLQGLPLAFSVRGAA